MEDLQKSREFWRLFVCGSIGLFFCTCSWDCWLSWEILHSCTFVSCWFPGALFDLAFFGCLPTEKKQKYQEYQSLWSLVSEPICWVSWGVTIGYCIYVLEIFDWLYDLVKVLCIFSFICPWFDLVFISELFYWVVLRDRRTVREIKNSPDA